MPIFVFLVKKSNNLFDWGVKNKCLIPLKLGVCVNFLKLKFTFFFV